MSTAFEQTMLWILVPILIIVLLLIVIIAARVAFTDDRPQKIEEVDFNTLNTGDILGVGYTHPFGWFVTAWSGSVWSHTGIVWKDPESGEIFVLEAAMYHGQYRGVFKIPLVLWLRINRKFHLGVTRLKGKPVDPVQLLEAFEKRKAYVKLESYNWRWYRLLYKQRYFEDNRKSYTCYEIVVTVLQDIGVIKKKYACSSYFPCDIMTGRISMEEGYHLEPPVMLDVKKHTMLREAEERNRNKGMFGGTCFTSWSSD
jgi:hypothetical protein